MLRALRVLHALRVLQVFAFGKHRIFDIDRSARMSHFAAGSHH
jgi:hypothetical protein